MSQSNETPSGTLEALLEQHKIPTLYSVLSISADSNAAEIQNAIATLRSSTPSLSAEQAYAIEILGKPEERQRYDAQLRSRLSAKISPTSPNTASERKEHPVSPPPSPPTPNRSRFALLTMCVALAGLGGWSYLNGLPKPLSKLANAAGIETSIGAQQHKCTPIKVKQYSNEQKQAAMARISNRGWEFKPEYMSVALENLAEGKPDAYEIVTDFLVAGIDLNTPTQAVSQPIMSEIWAHDHDTATMLKLFLEHGANINNPYELPLVKAAVQGNLALAKHLIEHCANVNLRQAAMMPGGYVLAKGHTPLTAAIYGGGQEKPLEERIALVHLMLDHGANVNQLGGDNMAPVHDASTADLEILKLLVEQGAKLDNPWILFAAINFRREENAIYLIQKGANTTWSHNGQTLTSVARARGLSRVERLLQENGV